MITLPRIKPTILLREPRFFFEWLDYVRTIGIIVIGSILFISISMIFDDNLTWGQLKIGLGCILLLLALFILVGNQTNEVRKKFNIPIFEAPKKSFRNHLRQLKREIFVSQKDRMIFALVGLGVFLPIRLIYYTYVSSYFGTNLGLLTGITLVLYVLIKKKKLGKIGEAIERALIKLTAKKWTRRIKIIAILWIVYYGGQMVVLDWLTTANHEDVSLLSAYFYFTTDGASGTLAKPDPNAINYVLISNPDILANQLNKIIINPIDIGSYIANIFMKGQLTQWYSHYNAFMFAESLEGFILFYFDRKMYRKGIPGGIAWENVGLDNIKVRTFRHKTIIEKLLH